MAQLDIDFSKQYLEWLKQNIEQYQVFYIQNNITFSG